MADTIKKSKIFESNISSDLLKKDQNQEFSNKINTRVNYNGEKLNNITTEIFDFSKYLILKQNNLNIESNLDASDYEYIKEHMHELIYNDKYCYGFYGGNQGRALNVYLNGHGQNYVKIVKRWFPNITDEELVDYFNAMDEVGCGYVALSNYIMESYKDDPEQFEKDFGFPIAHKEADGTIMPTTNLLFCDLYCYANKKGIIKPEINNIFDILSPITKLLNIDIDNPNKFNFNSPTYAYPGSSERNNGTLTDSRNDILNSNRYIKRNIELKTIKEFCGENQNQDIDYFNIVKSHIENGEVIELSAIDYTLSYVDENNNILKGYDPIEYKDASHAMTITGVTDDNKYIVSTWGYKYILDPASLDENYGLNYIEVGKDE